MMDTMTAKERVLAAINRQKVDRVPCGIANMAYFTARHYGIKIADAMNPANMGISQKMFEELGGYDFAPGMGQVMKGPFSGDTSYIFAPLKMLQPGKELPPDSIPQILEQELMKPEEYDFVIRNGWLKYAKEYIKSQLGDQGFGGRPSRPPGDKPDVLAPPPQDPLAAQNIFTLAEYSGAHIMSPYDVLAAARSLDKFIIDLYRRPDKVVAAMEVVTDEIVEMIRQDYYENKTMQPTLWMWGGRGSAGFISPKQFEKFELPFFKRILAFSTSHDALIQLHFDQSWTKFLPYFREFPEGQYILLLDGMTDIFKAKEIVGDRMCLMGDVPATMFKFGTPQEVAAYCRKLIDVVGKGSGFILSSGCDVPHDAKFENVKAMVDTAKYYRPAE